jgi:hypothetical protein
VMKQQSDCRVPGRMPCRAAVLLTSGLTELLRQICEDSNADLQGPKKWNPLLGTPLCWKRGLEGNPDL